MNGTSALIKQAPVFAAVAQQDQQCLGSSGTQVQSPALHRLRIQSCSSCGLGYNCSTDLIPGPGTLYAEGGKERRKEGRKEDGWEEGRKKEGGVHPCSLALPA